jgi:hypothetical protein
MKTASNRISFRVDRLSQLACPNHLEQAEKHHQATPIARPPQSNIELMTEKQILGFKPTPRLEQINDEQSECVQDRKHRLQ